MITFSQIGKYGRLGNQLFQYAILISVRNKLGYEIKLPNFKNRVWHGQKCLLNNFNISASYLTNNDVIKHSYIEKKNENFTYNPNVYNISDNTDFFGFFQNYSYYKDVLNELKEEFKLNNDVVEKNREIINNIKNEHKGYEIVSLHLRRGDTDLSMYGNDKLLKNSLWYRYFNDAKEVLKNKKIKFLLFSGGNRINDNSSSEYNWCKNNFIGDEYLHLNDERSTIDDFSLMQLCDHHILSPISSFSWWIGYLNVDDNKKIIAPLNYNFLKKNMGDNFYPPHVILK